MKLIDDASAVNSMVSDQNGIRFQGAILTLKDFTGDVTV
jgi:hypothetical protein